MATFAVVYSYIDDPLRLDEHRPEHRAFLRGLHDEGFLIASGPFTDGAAGALLLVEAAGTEAIASLLDADPFRREGLISERQVHGWDVVIGDLGGSA